MSKVIESFYLCERFTVNWKKVDEWFNAYIEAGIKQLKREGKLGEVKRI